MIRRSDILSWSHQAPWGEQWQVEQDLVISRAIIELFSDPLLADTLRFRGGTALNKLFFIEALRYSEDIDLVRTNKGPIYPLRLTGFGHALINLSQSASANTPRGH